MRNVVLRVLLVLVASGTMNRIVSSFCIRNAVQTMSRNKYSAKKNTNIFEPKIQNLYDILSDRGVISIGDAKELLGSGKIRVNERYVSNGEARYSSDCNIEVENVPLLPTPVVAVYHKPVGIHCTNKDPWDRTSLEYLSNTWPFLKRMHAVVSNIFGMLLKAFTNSIVGEAGC
jgi:hypothetical protein